MEDWVVQIVGQLGVVGIGLLMFAENVFPPLPSEVIMPLPRFLFLSSIGTVIWTTALAYAGRFLGQRFRAVEQYIGPVSRVLIAVAVITYVYRVVRIRREHRAGQASSG